MQVNDEYHCDNTGTFFYLWGGRENDDLNRFLDDHFQRLVAVRTPHRESALGVENGIFEDDVGAVRTIA